MQNAGEFEYDDLQGLIRFGFGNLTETCFLLLLINDPDAAKEWLKTAPITNAVKTEKRQSTALQIAFTATGLDKLGVNGVINGFSDEFIFGMTGDSSRSRRLGDIEDNAPNCWAWGGNAKTMPHVLLMLYAEPGGVADWRKKVEGKQFAKAFKVLMVLPTLHHGDQEPFGFADGISQPVLDWQRQQTTDPHKRFTYSNLLAVGEVVLGYPNEYGQYTNRPLLNPKESALADMLPAAEDQRSLKDFGRNGSYLVLRQLGQDVPGFWQFVDKAAGSSPKKREQLAAAMVGRKRDGSPLMTQTEETIPGIPQDDATNHFTYVNDPRGQKCPFGSHVRRANPRTGDLPAGVTGWWSWFVKTLGFGLVRQEDDLIASTRFHRLLRRGRSYGDKISPEDALKPNASKAERGLQFICLVANIQRQFEFVQNAWIVNSKFAGLQQERDPLLSHRQPLITGEKTDEFHQPDTAGPMLKTCGLQQFITVRGGAYFFLPGLRAIKYIAAVPLTAKSAKGSEY